MARAMIVLRNTCDPSRGFGLADGERIAPNTPPPASAGTPSGQPRCSASGVRRLGRAQARPSKLRLTLKRGGDRKEKGGPFSPGPPPRDERIRKLWVGA